MEKTSLKEVVAGILFVGSSIATFWLWHKVTPAIVSGELTTYTFFILPVAGLVGTAVLFAFAATFIKNHAIAIGAILIGIGAPYFFVPATRVVVGAFVVSVLLVLYAIHRVHREYILSLGFSLSKILNAGLPIYFTVAALIVSVFYSFLVDQEKAISILLPKPALNFTLKALAGPIQQFTGIPKIDPNETVNDLLDALIQSQLQAKGFSISQVSPAILNQQRHGYLLGLSENYKIKLTGKERVGDVLYTTITERAETLLGPYKSYLPAISVVGFFLAFKTLTWPLFYISLFILAGLVRLMTALQLLKKEKLQIEVEKLSL